MDDIGGQGCTYKGMSFAGVMQEPQFQGYQALSPQLDLLYRLMLLPIPDRQRVTVVILYFCWIEALQILLSCRL